MFAAAGHHDCDFMGLRIKAHPCQGRSAHQSKHFRFQMCGKDKVRWLSSCDLCCCCCHMAPGCRLQFRHFFTVKSIICTVLNTCIHHSLRPGLLNSFTFTGQHEAKPQTETISRAASMSLLAHYFIFCNQVSLVLANTDQYDTLCVSGSPLAA